MTESLTAVDVVGQLLKNFDDEPAWVLAQLSRLVQRAERLEHRPKNSNLTEAGLQFQLSSILEAGLRCVQWGKDSAGLFAELESAGFDITELSDLTTAGLGNKSAVQILVNELGRTRSPEVRSTILAELASEWAAPYAIASLFSLFKQIDPTGDPDPNSLRWQIADVFRQYASVAWEDELLGIAADPANGDSRLLTIEALGRFSGRKKELTPVMLEFLNTQEMVLYLPAASALGRWGVQEARPRMQWLIDTSSDRRADPAQAEWESDQLRKALWRIGSTPPA